MIRKDISELLKKYEQGKLSNKHVYFDAHEFEELAEYFDAQNDLDTAKEIIDYGLSIHPLSSSLIIKKLKIFVYNDRYEEALALISRSSLEYDFDLYLLKLECYLQLGMPKKAQATVDELLKNEEEDMGNVLAEIGFLYVEAELYDPAVSFLEESLKYNPNNTEVLSDLAYVYEAKGNLDAAINAHNKILDIDSYTYDSWVNIAKLYSLKDEFEKAVDAFDFALTINEKDQNTLKMKAHCLSLCGRMDEAIEIFNALLKADPQDSSLYFLLVDCYLTTEMFGEAAACLDEYEENIQVDIDVIAKRANVYMEQGSLQKALEIIIDGLEDYPHSSELFMIAGEIYYKQKMYEKSEAFFEEAYEINEDNTFIIERLATLSILKEDYQRSLSLTEKLYDMEPYNITVKNRLALLYFELDDRGAFNALLDEFEHNELQLLFQIVFSYEPEESLSKQTLIYYLNEARECRTLFKNMKF